MPNSYSGICADLNEKVQHKHFLKAKSSNGIKTELRAAANSDVIAAKSGKRKQRDAVELKPG
ncbi:MAG: hypothetical protein R6W92_09190 [Desulfocurvibacter africanus]